MNYKRIERDRSNSPLKTELLIRKNEEKSFQNKIEETSNQVKKNEIDFEQKNLIKEKRDPSEEDISKKDIKITERKRSLSPVNDNQNYDFKQNTSKNVENHSKRTETIKKENMSPKFAGSKEKNESKHNLNNLNESMIPLNTETMNFSMQNDSTSEFLMNELNSQKKNPNNYKPYSNKNMSVINEQNEEENLKNHKKIEEEKENNYEKEEKLKKLRKIEEEKFKNQKKKNPPFQNTLTEEDNRTTHISKYLDKIMVEMNIDDNHDNKILKTLYGLTQSKGSVKHDDKNLEKINQEVLTTKKNENLTKNLRKADNPSEFISSKSRSELTFAENNSSQRKETNKKENQFEKDVDDIGNEVSEEETSKRNTEMHKRNMEENINKNKNKHKNVNGIKIQKEDWMNTDEDSLDDEDMNNYFKQFEKERKISEEKEDFLPKFGISKKDEDLERKLENKINKMKDFKDSKDQKVKNDQFIEMNLDKKISESQNQFNQKNEENIDHSDFNFKSRKKDQNFKEITLHDHPLYKETKALKKTIPISKVKNKINEEELLEIHDSDLDKGFFSIKILLIKFL